MRTPPRDKTEAAETAAHALLNINVRYPDPPSLVEGLRLFLRDLPPLPDGWDGEDGEQGTPEQHAQNVSGLIVNAYDSRGIDDPFGLVFQLLVRLERIQEHAVRRTTLDPIGEISGYSLWAKVCRDADENRIAIVQVYEQGASFDQSEPLLVLPIGATRREVLIAIAAWERGIKEGQSSTTRKMRLEMGRIREEVMDILTPDI